MDKDKFRHSAIHIGMRNLKTGLSVLLCLLFYYFTKRDGALFAGISAIVCMQDNVEKSMTSGISRMCGTFIGATEAMVFLYLYQRYPYDFLKIGSTALGVMLLILFCNLLKRNDSIVIAGMVFLVIMIGTSEQSPFLYSINRLVDTLIGILVAVVVNRLLWDPEKHKHPVEKTEDDPNGQR